MTILSLCKLRKQKPNTKKTHESVDTFPSYYKIVSHTVATFECFAQFPLIRPPRYRVMLYFGQDWHLLSTALLQGTV